MFRNSASRAMVRSPTERLGSAVAVLTSIIFFSGSCDSHFFSCRRSPLRLNRSPTTNMRAWTAASDIQHTWSKDQFELQVFARLQDDEGVERLAEYEVSASKGQVMTKKQNFNKAFRNYTWKTEKSPKSKNRPEQNTPVGTVECDIYLRCQSEDLDVKQLFSECVDNVTNLTLTNNSWETQKFGILLAEVAETPNSLRSKLFQLERALTWGPAEITDPACCVVCINGDRARFDAAVRAAVAGLRALGVDAKLNSFPVYAIWMQFRNTYAEIRKMREQIDNVKKEMKDSMDTMKDDMDTMKKEMKDNMDTMKKEMKKEMKDEMKEMQATLLAAMSSLSKANKD